MGFGYALRRTSLESGSICTCISEDTDIPDREQAIEDYQQMSIALAAAATACTAPEMARTDRHLTAGDYGTLQSPEPLNLDIRARRPGISYFLSRTEWRLLVD